MIRLVQAHLSSLGIQAFHIASGILIPVRQPIMYDSLFVWVILYTSVPRQKGRLNLDCMGS